ncbi:DUF2169 family type VI secretion system accessory protein [Burkholderia ubonensis]|uniref:DUF2169 domain-containing protein n=1 Tax=Burkholderia ubonensis TaxID=101571 RepID=A0A1R1JJ41_9BURK|nr:DUF2169 domain-containing protein [Burkholderia ubonensis]OMG75182.1 hypothetical protein BW685_00555 [Burkholderia ubonensis]
MEFRNYTPFPALAFESAAPGGARFHTVVLRQTFALRDGELVLSGTQKPLATTDRFYGVSGRSSVIEESDLAPYKPRCDVVVSAVAYAPHASPTPRFGASVRVVAAGRTRDRASSGLLLDGRISVTGPRRFVRGRSWALAEPEPIISLPIRYEYAWGGQCRIDTEDEAAARIPGAFLLTAAQQQDHPDRENPPAAHTVCEANPLGVGYVQRWFIDAARPEYIPAPQIEWEDARVTAQSWAAALSGEGVSMPDPAGFGLTGRAWLPRRSLAGTFDRHWLEAVHPELPENFTFDYWNGANRALQAPLLKGDETIVLTNLSPPGSASARVNSLGDTELRVPLPGHLPMGWFYTRSALEFAAFRIDTVLIDVPGTAEPNVTLVWRATVWNTKNAQRFEARYIDRGEKLRLSARRKPLSDVINGGIA